MIMDAIVTVRQNSVVSNRPLGTKPRRNLVLANVITRLTVSLVLAPADYHVAVPRRNLPLVAVFQRRTNLDSNVQALAIQTAQVLEIVAATRHAALVAENNRNNHDGTNTTNFDST
jgi:hypothetical protein